MHHLALLISCFIHQPKDDDEYVEPTERTAVAVAAKTDPEEKKKKGRATKSSFEITDLGVVLPIVADDRFNWFSAKFGKTAETKEACLAEITSHGVSTWGTVQFMEKTVNTVLDDFDAQIDGETGAPPEMFVAVEKECRFLSGIRRAKAAAAAEAERSETAKESKDAYGDFVRQNAVNHANGDRTSVSESVRSAGARELAEKAEKKLLAEGEDDQNGQDQSMKKRKTRSRGSDQFVEIEAQKTKNAAAALELQREELQEKSEARKKKLELETERERNRHAEALARQEHEAQHNALMLKMMEKLFNTK
jgi:hypothetical protein